MDETRELDTADATDHADPTELPGMGPHLEGGSYRQLWVATHRVRVAGRDGSRPAATAIHYRLAPGEQARWHRVGSDELWLWQGGGPLRLVTATQPPENPGHLPETRALGPDAAAGQSLHLLVPAGAWQSTAPVAEAVLVVCVVAPGFDARDYDLL
jgi:predicted cupin superfamily sugar epimerase